MIDNIKRNSEPIDLCLRYGYITKFQHKLALKLRWLYTLNFGLPTVQAYNINRVRGRDISKYDDETLYEKRQEYNRIITSLYKENRQATKLFLNVLIHHYRPDFLTAQTREAIIQRLNKAYNIPLRILQDRHLLKEAAQNLEHICDKSQYRKIEQTYDYKTAN